jgi:hypothetical protein
MIFADSGEEKETIGNNPYASWHCTMTGTYIAVPSYSSNPIAWDHGDDHGLKPTTKVETRHPTT